MDAETRHKLKQNQLGEAIDKITHVQPTDPRIIYPVLAVVLIALGYWGYTFRNSRQGEAVAAGWRLLTTAQVSAPGVTDQAISNLREVADNGPARNLRDGAQLRLADALRTQALETNDPKLLGDAQQAYRALAEDSSVATQFRAPAIYNIGLMAENLRDFDAARASYERLDAEAYAGSPFREMAAARIEDLERISSNVSFEPGFPPTPDLLLEVPEPAGPQAPADDEADAADDTSADADAPAEDTPPADPASDPPAGDPPGRNPVEEPVEDPVADPSAEPVGSDTPTEPEVPDQP